MNGCMRTVTIQPVLNGFIVQVGCQTLVYQNIEFLARDLVEYQKDPERVEVLFRRAAINKTLERPGEPVRAGLLNQRQPEPLPDQPANCFTPANSTVEGAYQTR